MLTKESFSDSLLNGRCNDIRTRGEAAYGRATVASEDIQEALYGIDMLLFSILEHDLTIGELGDDQVKWRLGLMELGSRLIKKWRNL